MSRHLFTPFNTEAPQACKLSIVRTELMRYIKRSNARADYIMIATSLRQRLSVREFPSWFLQDVFRFGPIVRYGAYQLRSTVGLLYQDPNTLCYESTYQIYDMTNTGIVPCLDQVHVYIDIGYFTTTLGTTTESSSTIII
jgi:hypothetical protein